MQVEVMPDQQQRLLGPETPLRRRILAAAFATFTEKGYSGAGTREIAARARVSKRELYAEFAGKKELLAACVASRADRIRRPPRLPAANDAGELAAQLEAVGAEILRELSSPQAVAVIRLAVVEAELTDDVAQTVDRVRRTNLKTLATLIGRARRQGLLGGKDDRTAAEEFVALLWGDLRMRLLLKTAGPPTAAEIRRRARRAAAAIAALHPAGTPRATGR